LDNKLLYRIRVTGRVQGVGFRWTASREARDLGINGYVRNMTDGSVLIEAEGTREQLEAFTGWCRNGPGYVESVDVDVFPPVNYSGFQIKH
jgi:acylphosphatase